MNDENRPLTAAENLASPARRRVLSTASQLVAGATL
jgi:hypothetical protein